MPRTQAPCYGIGPGPATAELDRRITASRFEGRTASRRGWAAPSVTVKRDYLLEAAGVDPDDLNDEARYAISVLATDPRVEVVGGLASLLAIACEKAASR